MLLRFCLTALCAIAGAGAALAHISLLNKETKAGATYKAVFSLSHGCKGAATQGLRVKLPVGVVTAKPEPKPGWQTNIVTGNLDTTFINNGVKVTAGVTQIAWTGGNLPDGKHDEFVMQVSFADSLASNTMLYFPVVQECGAAVERWIEIPAAGKKADDYANPAPGVLVKPN